MNDDEDDLQTGWPPFVRWTAAVAAIALAIPVVVWVVDLLGS